MNIILFCHPSFLPSQSMPRFAKMIAEGMQARGHSVELWSPRARFYRLPVPRSLKKWLGYIDQYILFPLSVRIRMAKQPKETLYVFADQALGPWVPLVASRPHVIHCHDFLALRSALGQIPENPTSGTGKIYQEYIRKGFGAGCNFISVSQKTKDDLRSFLPNEPVLSEVVYNGLNPLFSPRDLQNTRRELEAITKISLAAGFLLHVGGNQWYKNRRGVVEIYNQWRKTACTPLPLLLVGPKASSWLGEICAASPYSADIHLLDSLNDQQVALAYAGASLFLFPSLAEGFGWPIAEAMAAGCPVITTGEAPMTEVAGDCALLIPRRPQKLDQVTAWAKECAAVVDELLQKNPAEREQIVNSGIKNASRFDANQTLLQIENLYRQVLSRS